MRKWIYLVVGAVLVINGIAVLVVAAMHRTLGITVLFQTAWGVVGAWLLFKSVRLFTAARQSKEE